MNVTQRIKQIKQPRGGYLPIKNFEVSSIEGSVELEEQSLENVSPNVVGATVDNLFRYMTNGYNVEDAFDIGMKGLKIAINNNRWDLVNNWASNILNFNRKQITKQIIYSALALTEFDAIYRAGIFPDKGKYYTQQTVSKTTINNIKKMVQNSLRFAKKYGGVIDSNITFEGGYSNVVTKGDGDFITKDTLWDMKCIKSKPTPKHTLQILMYYIMAKKSKQEIYKDLEYVGIWNPKLNKVYRFKMLDLDKSIIKEIKQDVIVYKK